MYMPLYLYTPHRLVENIQTQIINDLRASIITPLRENTKQSMGALQDFYTVLNKSLSDNMGHVTG